MIKNYLKTAFRSFWKHKLFTCINIIGLSIGTSAALIIFLIVNYDTSFDKFHPDGNRIYRVVTNFTFAGQPAYNAGVCGPLAGAVKNEVGGVETVAPFYKIFRPDVSIPVNGNNGKRFMAERHVILADAGYFKLIDYKWISGSPQAALSSPYQVVLTTRQAAKYFPRTPYEAVVGKVVMYDTIKTTVSGIVEPLKHNTGFTFSDFISYSTGLANRDLKSELRLDNWGGTTVKSQLFIRLAANAKPLQIAGQLNQILKQNSPSYKNKTQAFALQPLADIHFNTNYGGIANYDEVANKTTLYSLSAIASFLLILGCINFINLTTAQATQRAKEIGIRKTMGSSRAQLVFQFLSETFIITLITVIISAAFTPVLLQLFSGFVPEQIKFDLFNQPVIIFFLLLLAFVVSLLSGFYPAIVLSGYKPVSVLKNQMINNGGKSRNAWMRQSLTVTQLVIAQFFIMATVLVSKQIYFALHRDLGFKKDAIVTINSPYKNRKASSNKLFFNDLKTLPQVADVSAGNDAPASENTSSTEALYVDGKKEIKLGNLDMKFGDEHYINLYHIKLLAGRNLQPRDTNNAMLANLTLVKTLGFKSPADAIGKVLDNFNGDRRMEIIGVVSDFHQESLHAPILPLVVVTSNNVGFNGTFHVALKPETANGNEWRTAIANMQSMWKRYYPADDFDYEFVDDSVARFYIKERRTAALLNWATGLSVLISCLGLLGLAIYTTNQRTKEIGVRKVLGATVMQIAALLSKELAFLVGLAFALAMPVAWWAMHQWMQNFAERTTISWWIFVISGGGMLLSAMLTSGFQTIKAALANPSKSLKSE